MEKTDMNIKEIMYSCGFNDLPNLSRQFRKAYGMPPGLTGTVESSHMKQKMNVKPVLILCRNGKKRFCILVSLNPGNYNDINRIFRRMEERK
jgi:AraC-like DNA-binding protein